ncbi:MAG: UDP-N-acetylmuramoyl-L-alanyl-D-glutamate--2,6-diaminopimelate ligase [Thermoleophilia bacterium]
MSIAPPRPGRRALAAGDDRGVLSDTVLPAKRHLSRAPGPGARRPTLLESAPIELDALSHALRPARTLNPRPAVVDDLAYDSRQVTPGSLFVCVPGQRVDGHAHAAQAVAAGAVALVVERELDLPVPQLVVEDARRAMADAADAFFGRPSLELELAGVTGTNGKTTTAFLLFAMLAAAGRRPGLLGTIERRVGGERRAAVRTTAEAIDLQRDLREMLDAGDRSCALEASSHAAALDRLRAVRFRALAFTNLTQDHLDFHGTMEAYFQAKRRLFVEPGPDGWLPAAAIGIGDEYGRRLADELAAGERRLLRFGLEEDADVRADALELTAAGATFAAAGLELRTSLRGRFNVENVLAAVAVGRLLGLPDGAIVRGVASLRGVPGRFEAVDAGQPFAVIVDYAHTPDALGRVLEAARELCTGRLTCVFGCGGDRDRGQRPAMGAAAAAAADRVLVTSDNPRSEDPAAIVEEILEGAGPGAEVELDRARAIERALREAAEGDVVVLAGKGHEPGQEIAGEILPFDDRDVAERALRALATGTPG